MNEKRQKPRIRAEGIDVYLPESSNHIGQVHNMTPYGLRITGQTGLLEGHFQEIELRWEKEIEGRDHMAVDVLTIWCEEIDGTQFCGVKLLASAEEIGLFEKIVVAHTV